MPVIVINTLDIPPQVDFYDLRNKEKGLLVGEDEVKLLEQVMAKLDNGRHSKAKLGKAMWELSEELSKQPGYSGPYWEKDKDASHGILKEPDGSLHAIYYGKKWGRHLGEGGFGKVKLMQDIKDGKWRALKVVKLSKNVKEQEPERKMVEEEHKTLKELKISEGIVTERKSGSSLTKGPSVLKAHFGMEYTRGVQVEKFLFQNPPVSAVRWLDIALQSVERIDRLHGNKYLHCDIIA